MTEVNGIPYMVRWGPRAGLKVLKGTVPSMCTWQLHRKTNTRERKAYLRAAGSLLITFVTQRSSERHIAFSSQVKRYWLKESSRKLLTKVHRGVEP